MHGTNLPAEYDAIRERLQYREILTILSEQGTTNDKLLYRWLTHVGLAVPWRRLEQMFDRLDNEGLTRSSRIETTRVIEMARDGKEVALGIVSLDWIEPPEPPAA
jgi:hypothetical protein